MAPRKFVAEYSDNQSYPFLLNYIGQVEHLIFIHIPKTGGTSIGKALGFSSPDPEKKIGKHYALRDIKQFLPTRIWDRSFRFTFLRNPFERLFSQYLYRKRNNRLSREALASNGFNWWVSQNLSIRPYGNLQPQLDWITDHQMHIKVHFVGRFEFLQDDFDELCNHICIKPQKLPHLNNSLSKLNYMAQYDDDTYDLVNSFYSQDISFLSSIDNGPIIASN